MSFPIENRFNAVEKVVNAACAKGLDTEIASYHCKLGCVLICGAIERSVEVLITERIASRSPPQVAQFLKAYFKRGTNYDCEEILQLLFKFDSAWGKKFEVFLLANERIKSGVASCYATRNSIAHGGGQSLGPKALREYFDAAFTLIVELEKLLRP